MYGGHGPSIRDIRRRLRPLKTVACHIIDGQGRVSGATTGNIDGAIETLNRAAIAEQIILVTVRSIMNCVSVIWGYRSWHALLREHLIFGESKI